MRTINSKRRVGQRINRAGRACVRAILLGALAAVSAQSAETARGATQPNVIIVWTDDQGYGDLSCHGNPVLKTPNLDRLHAQSVRFTDFHVAPMCSPSRGQLMSGRDAAANGATAVCQGRSMIREGVPTMAESFRRAGYRTGHFGKWHLGDSYPYRPQDRGFEETVHHAAWGITSLADYWGNDYFDDIYRHNGTLQRYEGYCNDVWFREAMAWMKQRADNRERFFCYLATNVPHVPLLVEEKYSEPYKGTFGGRPLPASFYGMIANFDENLGKLEEFLRASGLRENTLLIFMTDNGSANRQAVEIHNAGMRGMKTTLWEGGHRVPCFVRWPAGPLGEPRDIDELTQIQDLFPTLTDLCGLQEPQAVVWDGTSLAGLLRGMHDSLPDRKLVVQYGADLRKWRACVMWKKWRLIDGTNLYDLQSDPHQDRNVAEQHPEVFNAMRDHYEEWFATAEPLFNETRYIHLGSQRQNPIMLYSSDWQGGYADNRGGLSAGSATGKWPVVVEQSGNYKMELRRWPPEAQTPLGGKANLNGSRADFGHARPIAKARLKLGGFDRTIDCPPGSTAASFTVPLQAGKTTIETFFLDEKGKVLCSAFFTQVELMDQ